ncbi:MAG: DUF115 domain-containing protein [Thermoplasmata archaeon]|nr:DUF115 domain-containing protein [Thermoplasmata archaeon]
MDRDSWEPIYEEILDDMGYDRSSDESTARLLKVLMQMADLIEDDCVYDLMKRPVTVIGPASPDLSDLEDKTIVSAGSATEIVMNHTVPDIVVTDLDGDIQSQIDASAKGAITFIHAHGDNSDLVMDYAKEFHGPVILTTQATPDNVIRNYGGFTDGDRAVCICRHFGARNIELRGFDFDTPSLKDGSDPETKKRKLAWAKRIILDGSNDITGL